MANDKKMMRGFIAMVRDEFGLKAEYIGVGKHNKWRIYDNDGTSFMVSTSMSPNGDHKVVLKAQRRSLQRDLEAHRQRQKEKT